MSTLPTPIAQSPLHSKLARGQLQTLCTKAHQGNVGVVEQFLDNGFSPDISDDQGMTLLGWACLGGRESVVRLLLQRGADPNLVPLKPLSSKRTPLIHLCTRGVPTEDESKMSIFEMLMDKGAKTHHKDSNGDTALMHASGCAHFELLKRLIEVGSDANHTGFRGRTPLMEAAQKNMVQNCVVLLEAGASLASVNANQDTALSLAMEKGHVQTVAVLQSWRARDDARRVIAEINDLSAAIQP